MTSRLSDLAEAAGVSTATVSRVLNGKPGVSRASRDAVESAVRRLGYGRAARRATTGVVGLVMPPLSNPVFAAFAQALEVELYQQGVRLLICSRVSGGPGEEEYVQLLRSRGVDGIIITGGMHSDTTASAGWYDRLASEGVPFVLIHGATDDIRAPIVSVDEERSVALAVTHLRQLGHERIGLATGPTRYIPARRKVEAFLRVGGADAPGLVEEALYTAQGGELAAGRLLDRGVTAVVCGSDLIALGAISAARARGLRVPEDVSVIGHDDSLMVPYLDPPLTTIRQPVAEMSSGAVSLLLARIKEGGDPERAEISFRTELVVRASTAPRRATP